MNNVKRPAIFFDRDGVLVLEKDFLINPDDIEFYPDTFEALSAVDNFYIKIVISNQSGIARGFFTEEDVRIVNNRISELLAGRDIVIDGWYYCPHGPDDDCPCRKPRPGMILKAAQKHNIDLKESWIIGDKSSDIEAGKCAGVGTILVETGYGGGEPGASNVEPDFKASDLDEAIKYINGSVR